MADAASAICDDCRLSSAVTRQAGSRSLHGSRFLGAVFGAEADEVFRDARWEEGNLRPALSECVIERTGTRRIALAAGHRERDAPGNAIRIFQDLRGKFGHKSARCRDHRPIPVIAQPAGRENVRCPSATSKPVLQTSHISLTRSQSCSVQAVRSSFHVC